jgi:hypothetical protein
MGTLDAGRMGKDRSGGARGGVPQKPAIHRFPGRWPSRQELGIRGRPPRRAAERLWTEADGSDELRSRIEDLPGFGEMKVKALGSVLAKRFGVAAAEGLVPNHPTLGDVDSAEALAEYQAAKRAYKASLKAQKG